MNVAMGCPIRDQVKSLTHLDEIEKLEKFHRLSSFTWTRQMIWNVFEDNSFERWTQRFPNVWLGLINSAGKYVSSHLLNIRLSFKSPSEWIKFKLILELFTCKFQLNLYRSIALLMLYNFCFGLKFFWSSVRPQSKKNERRLSRSLYVRWQF